ncbi:hypothetical protein Tco_0636086 [Tanacetum coccineum]
MNHCQEGQPSNAQAMQAVEAWKQSDFLCYNYVLNGLIDPLWDVKQKFHQGLATTGDQPWSPMRLIADAEAGDDVRQKSVDNDKKLNIGNSATLLIQGCQEIKDEAIDKFVLYKTEVENQLGKKIKVVRSDEELNTWPIRRRQYMLGGKPYLTATYHLNKIPRIERKRTPYELWMGRNHRYAMPLAVNDKIYKITKDMLKSNFA